MQTTLVGNRGEQLVAEQLVRAGYTILERNWRTKYCEVDIIAQRQNVVYFVEVKYRATNRQGDGLDYITHAKLQHMYRAADIYVVKHGWQGEYQLMAAAVNNTGGVELREIA